jgi:hypothetical protein
MNCENKKTRADASEEKHLSGPFFAGERREGDCGGKRRMDEKSSIRSHLYFTAARRLNQGGER